MMIAKRSKGFTLVELLIVIVIIGILAGGMMLAYGSATDTAKASSIVSGLRNAKGAALIWFIDHAPSNPSPSSWTENNNATGSPFSVIAAMLDNKEISAKLKLATITDGNDYYFVGLKADSTSIAHKAFTQLGANGTAYVPRTDSTPIVLASTDNASFPTTTPGATYVFMLVK